MAITGSDSPQARAFLLALANSANVSLACRQSGVMREVVYRWRATDEAFAAAWAEALDKGLDALEDECMRRAMQGVEKPVVSMGKVVMVDGKPLVEHAYSDTLAMFLLKARRPERYRERSSVDLNVQGDLASAIEQGRKRAREGRGE